MPRITDVVEQLAAPCVQEAGCGLWDVEYLKEGGSWYLRIYIEREGGVSTSHCEQISRAVEPLLDEKDLIKEQYILEVSSAGIEKTLKKPEHFERSLGMETEASLYTPIDGAKTVRGILTEYDGTAVTIGGRTLNMKDVARVKLVYNF